MGNFKLTLGHLNLVGPDLHQHVRVAFSFPNTVTLSFQALKARTKMFQMFFLLTLVMTLLVIGQLCVGKNCFKSLKLTLITTLLMIKSRLAFRVAVKEMVALLLHGNT